MSYETIRFEVDAGVANIHLNRPDAANALNMQMGKEFMEVCLRCDADPKVRAVLITAEGKMFCGGGDLAEFASYDDEIVTKLKELTGYLHMGTSRLLRGDAPVVVAVQGVAAGAGMSIALGGDLVLASEKARFTMAYTKAGLVPDGGSTHLLPRVVGLRRAQELIFENRVLSAQEAQEWGVVTRVVAPEALLDQAREAAAKFAQGPTVAFGVAKRLLAGTFDTSLETQLELESRGICTTAVTADGPEGIHAFLEKRPAKFKGA